ncbi:MAG: AAA family ATPase [Lachnospiraceae bacterium]|nr:AAA family ATPase [Lachnospiraceae bacterium]
MKIAVCGKGGSGKSTFTALLAKEFAARGKKVLVIDSDESNYGLHLQLGLPLPESLTDYMGGKGQVMEYLAGGPQNMPLLFDRNLKMSDIPAEYYSEKDGIRLMTPGKIQQVNEACACAFAAILGQFLEVLHLEEDEIVIMDMEAGTEHFGRGTDNAADLIVMVVDPSMESLKLSGRVAEMSRSIGKKSCFVLNKVTPEFEELMKETVSPNGEILAVLSADGAIQKAGIMGRELSISSPQIREAAGRLLTL